MSDESHGFEHIADDLPVQIGPGRFEQTQHMLNRDFFIAGIFPVFFRPAGFELGNLTFAQICKNIVVRDEEAGQVFSKGFFIYFSLFGQCRQEFFRLVSFV